MNPDLSIRGCFKTAYKAVIASPGPAIKLSLSILLILAFSMGARFVAWWISLPGVFITPLLSSVAIWTALRIADPVDRHQGSAAAGETYSRLLQLNILYTLIGLASQLPSLMVLWMATHTHTGESSMAGIVVAVLLGLAGSVAAAAYTLRYLFSGFFLVANRDYSVRVALQASEALTQGHRKELFLLLLAGLLVIGLGILCFYVGVLFAIPVVTVASATAYRRLLQSRVGIDGAAGDVTGSIT